jgi:hypothetical protein
MTKTSARGRSAVEDVRHCGLRLVRRRGKQHGRRVSVSDFGKLDWTPWKLESTKRFPSDDQLSEWSAWTRLGNQLMRLSKEELIEMHGTVEHRYVDRLMGELAQTAEHWKFLAGMLETAYVRVAAAAVERQRRGKPFRVTTEAASRRLVK